jgi:hypothetical protein
MTSHSLSLASRKSATLVAICFLPDPASSRVLTETTGRGRRRRARCLPDFSYLTGLISNAGPAAM